MLTSPVILHNFDFSGRTPKKKVLHADLRNRANKLERLMHLTVSKIPPSHINCSIVSGSKHVLRAPTPLTKDVSRVYPPISLSSPVPLPCVPLPCVPAVAGVYPFRSLPLVLAALVRVLPTFPSSLLLPPFFFVVVFLHQVLPCPVGLYLIGGVPVLFALTPALCAPLVLCFFRAPCWTCVARTARSPIIAYYSNPPPPSSRVV